MMADTKIDEVRGLALRLQAIGQWQADQVQHMTETAKTLLESARWLSILSRRMCGAGIIGCRGGADCTSDHK
jgi:hypothetical protein